MDIQILIQGEFKIEGPTFERNIDFGFAKGDLLSELERLAEFCGDRFNTKIFDDKEELVTYLDKMERKLDLMRYLLHCIRYEANNWGIPDDATFYIHFG